ncbi:hypothetical protein RIF29_17779 [Crotalaria pallida]|uniref:Uncharacterized protein n=1 Tax=Crotalaria pallida TaxID=3830 RepID=A0AAN9E3J8_CROPI
MILACLCFMILNLAHELDLSIYVIDIDKFLAVELERDGNKTLKKEEEEWQKELESVRNQHALDVAALLSTTQKLQRIRAEKAEILSAELTRLKALLDSQKP